jgi:hypothetical protein
VPDKIVELDWWREVVEPTQTTTAAAKVRAAQ